MRTKNYLFVLLLIVSITTISAVIEMDTSIKINTVPNFNVTISIKDTSGHYHFETKDSGKDGSVLFGFKIQSMSYELATITLKRAGDDEPAYFKRFGDTYNTGEFVELNSYPQWYTPPEPENKTNTAVETTNVTSEINSTLNETESTSETSPESSDRKVTAFSVSNGEIKLNSRMLLYVFGIMVLAIFTILFIRWERKKPRPEKKIKVTKLSEVNKVNEDTIKKQEERIEQAKRELQQAQDELKKLKDPNSNKIEQAKKKLIEDQKELMRLREESKQQTQENSGNQEDKENQSEDKE